MKEKSPSPERSFAGFSEAAIRKRIAYRLRRLRLPESEIDDVQQEALNALLAAIFDGDHASGASAQTFVTRIIDHKILDRLRRRQRLDRRQVQAELARAASTDDPEDQGPEAGPADAWEAVEAPRDPLELKIDVREALAALPERERQVCVGLSEGRSVKEIARQLGCGRDTVDRLIARVRARFSELGLHEWIMAPEEAAS